MPRVRKQDGVAIEVSPATKGAISEHIATAWLLKQGYDVFRNVSPNGRADLLAVDWVNDKTVRVDVKSRGFSPNGKGERASADRGKFELNKGFDIRYLIVDDEGACEWYSDQPKSDNDNVPPLPLWWICTKTRQRFKTPGNDMSGKDWSFFCHWLVRAYPDYVIPFSESFVRDVSARGIGRDHVRIESKEFTVLEKLRRQVFDKLVDTTGAIELRAAA